MSYLSSPLVPSEAMGQSAIGVSHVYHGKSILVARQLREYQKVYDLFDSGQTVIKIAKQMERSHWYVKKILDERRKAAPPVPDIEGSEPMIHEATENCEQIYKMFKQLEKEGMALREIAAHFGLSYEWVGDIIRRFEKVGKERKREI